MKDLLAVFYWHVLWRVLFREVFTLSARLAHLVMKAFKALIALCLPNLRSTALDNRWPFEP